MMQTANARAHAPAPPHVDTAPRPAVFACLAGPDAGVFESQVFEYGRFAATLGVDFRYCFFEGVQARWRAGEQLAERMHRLRARYRQPMALRFVLAPLSPVGLWRAASVLARAVGECGGDRVLVHARGAPAACAAVLARNRYPQIAVLYDARGDEAAEAELQGELDTEPRTRRKWRRRAQRLSLLQRRAAAEADHIVAVSTVLRDLLSDTAGVPHARISVVPCCVVPEHFARPAAVRATVRRRLGLEDKTVIAYSGSLGSYQIPDRIAALVGALRAQVATVHLLVISEDRAAAARHFGALAAAGAATLLACPFEEVGDLLAAADAALLLRQDNTVNRVACPVKFAEYQVAGLPVIATPGTGDVTESVRSTGFGVVVDLRQPPATQAAAVAAAIHQGRWPGLRDAIRRHAVAAFNRESYRPVYRDIFARLLAATGAAHGI